MDYLTNPPRIGIVVGDRVRTKSSNCSNFIGTVENLQFGYAGVRIEHPEDVKGKILAFALTELEHAEDGLKVAAARVKAMPKVLPAATLCPACLQTIEKLDAPHAKVTVLPLIDPSTHEALVTRDMECAVIVLFASIAVVVLFALAWFCR